MPKAEIIDTASEMGRTRDQVRCSCGAVMWLFRWSWAGHGKVRCKSCRSWIDYGTLEVRRP